MNPGMTSKLSEALALLMGNPVFLLIAIVVVLFLCIKLIKKLKKSLAFHKMSHDYLRWVKKHNGKNLDPLSDVSMQLRHGERAFWEESVALIEPKTVRTYLGAGPSIRITRGVSFRVNSGRSRSHKELQITDSGQFIITDERIVFVGNSTSFTIPFKKIVATKAHLDSVQINCEGRKSLIFVVVKNSLIVNQILTTILTTLRNAGEI